MAGRFSVRYAKDGQEESVHGGFRWEQGRAGTHIVLLSPLGQTLAVIDVTPNGAVLAMDGQAARSAADPDSLAAMSLGWPLPVSGLHGWLQGCGHDPAGHPFITTPQRDRATTREGWRLAYPAWESAAGSIRPKRIDLQRAAGASGEGILLRIVIDEWQPQP